MAPPPRQYVPAPGMNKPAAARVTRDTKTYLRRPGTGTPPAGTPPAGQAPHAHTPVDPYANPQAYIAKAVAGLGTPMTDAQIQSNAQAQLAPLIKALQDSIGAQSQSGMNAINGYTSNLAQHLAGFQQNAQNIYGGAEQSQAASDAALSQKLSGEGGQQAQDLGAKLASINAPGAVNQAVQGATGEAAGAGNALYATGGASLANLIASGAAEQSYASKLPGIAGLAGAQQVGNLQGELAKNLADQTGQLQGKVPDIVNSLEGQRTDLQGKRATLTQDLNQFFSDRGLKKKALAQERRALHLPDSSLSGKVGVVVDKRGNPVLKGGKPQLLPGYHVNAKGSVVKDAKPAGAAKPRTVDTSLSKSFGFLVDKSGNPILKNGQRQTLPKTSTTSQPKVNTTLSAANKYLTDNSGNPVLKNGKRQPYQPAAGTRGGPSVSQQKQDAEAFGAARHYHQPWKDKNGKTNPPLRWSSWVTAGLQKGISLKTLMKQGRKIYTPEEIKNDSQPGYTPGG